MRYSLFLLSFLLAAPAFAQVSLLDARDGADNSRFRVNDDGGMIVGGTYDGDFSAEGVPVEGPGTRLMWYARKAAFRVGDVRAGVTRDHDMFSSSLTTGDEWDAMNVGDFSVAMGNSTKANGTSSFAVGSATVASGMAAVAMGDGSVASGAASVALGYHAHTNSRQGTFVFADRSTVDVLRAGVNHSANWRVSGGFRLFTSSNLSTGVTIQSGASVSNWGQSGAVISTSTGAYLSTGGVWTNASDVNRKHQIEAVSGEEVLDRLRGLPIQTWSYRSEPASVRHMGPMAQDFRAAFGLGTDSTSIATVDADGVALAAAQALEARTREQNTRLDALQAENTELRARLDALEGERGPLAAGLPVAAALVALGGIGLASRRRTTGRTR